MKPINEKTASEALKQAEMALEKGKKSLAQKFARKAVFLDPGLEDAWLILAAVSPPESSVRYLDRVLAMNPDNQKAREGMRWASKQLRNQKPVINAVKPPKPILKRWPIFLFSTIMVLGLILYLGLGITKAAAQVTSSKITRPEEALFKPTLTPTVTPTTTPTPTPTPMPLPTATPDTYFAPYRYHSWDIPEEISDSNNLWIEIDLTNQMLYAYRGNQIISGFLVSTGTSSYATVTGTYKIYAKYTAYTMSGPDYFLEDVPFSMFFHKGYAVHGTYWHNNFGTPMSHGCVNMHTDDAAWLYQNAPVGTYVFVHY